MTTLGRTEIQRDDDVAHTCWLNVTLVLVLVHFCKNTEKKEQGNLVMN
jgi:hypothetical protein